MASIGVRVSGWRTPPGRPGGDPAFDSNGRAEPVHFKVLLRKTLVAPSGADRRCQLAYFSFCFHS